MLTISLRRRPSKGGLIAGPAEALYQPIRRQRDANRVGNVETHRTQLHHHATIDEHNPVDTMRVRVIEPHNITSS